MMMMKKRIKIIHNPFGAFLYADSCFTTLSNTSNIIINDKTIKRKKEMKITEN